MNKGDLHKKDDFKVPEKYFEGFENRLFEKIHDLEHSIPKKEGFKVPEKYFESFEENLFRKYNTPETSKVIRLKKYKSYYYIVTGIAASLVLFLMIRFFTPTDQLNFATLEHEEIENYLYANESSLNAYDIVQEFNDMELKEISLTDEILEEDDELIDYLNENTNAYDELIEDN
ncbi:hypothetical protein GTQ40_04765 [Flavobacteriaceae bacterium R38]|nr:hypothetical protein [Flavobacteriaceae bacterium R38]